MADSARRLLAIYLRDHRAGAVAGRRLARRLAKENRHPQWESLRTVAREIEADETTLVVLMKILGVAEGVIKKVAAAGMEAIEGLKPNGRLVRYSPLSRVVELESLMSGVTAKRRLWVSLRPLARDGNGLAGVDFDELDRRAVDQLNILAWLHDTAARLAFLEDPAPPTANRSRSAKDAGAV